MKDSKKDSKKEVENALKNLANDFKSSGKEILDGFSKKIPEEFKKEAPVEEAIMTVASIALSTGKIAELAGEGLKKIGIKFGASEQSSINKISKYLIEQGNAYTEIIESVIRKILSVTPGVSSVYNSLDDKQKKVMGKTVLTVILIFMMYKAGGEIWSYFKKGESLGVALKSALTGVKFTEVKHAIPIIMASVLPAAFVKKEGEKKEANPTNPTEETNESIKYMRKGLLVKESLDFYLRKSVH